jgi:hypothetical protein
VSEETAPLALLFLGGGTESPSGHKLWAELLTLVTCGAGAGGGAHDLRALCLTEPIAHPILAPHAHLTGRARTELHFLLYSPHTESEVTHALQ